MKVGEGQAGVAIFCCPCWAGAKTVDLILARSDYLQEAERQAVEDGAAPQPAQMQMRQINDLLAYIAQIAQAVSRGHAHDD